MLTDKKIQGLPVEANTKRHKDRDGLVIEVRRSGKKVYLFRFQWDKKPQTMTIGKCSSMKVAEARDIVSEYRKLLDRGIDPRPDQDKKFSVIADKWHEKNKSKWKDVTINRHAHSLEKDIYPYIGDKLIDDITKAHILEIIQLYEAKGKFETAHRLYARLKAIFEFAVGASITSNYPFLALKNALAAKPRVVNQPAISSNEAHELLQMVRISNVSKITKLYVELLAQLFSRPSELRLAKWEEFDFQRAEWHIPVIRMKMSTPHWVPLSPQVLTLLRELRAITGFTLG